MDELKRIKAGHASYLTRLCNEVETLMLSRENISQVASLKSKLVEHFPKYTKAHFDYMDGEIDENERTKSREDLKSRSENYTEIVDRISEWIQQCTDKNGTNGNIGLFDDRSSTVSNISASSSVKLRQAQIKQRLAVVKAQQLEKQLDMERLAKEKQLDLERQVKLQQASDKVELCDIELQMWGEQNDENTDTFPKTLLLANSLPSGPPVVAHTHAPPLSTLGTVPNVTSAAAIRSVTWPQFENVPPLIQQTVSNRVSAPPLISAVNSRMNAPSAPPATQSFTRNTLANAPISVQPVNASTVSAPPVNSTVNSFASAASTVHPFNMTSVTHANVTSVSLVMPPVYTRTNVSMPMQSGNILTSAQVASTQPGNTRTVPVSSTANGYATGTSVHSTDGMYASLNNLSDRLTLPRPVMIDFDGDAKNYRKFIVNFETHLANRVADPGLKLGYLIQYCKGDAKRLIEDCVLLDPLDGFNKALILLHKRYGQPHIIARSFIDGITKGCPIKNNDVQALVNLSNELNKCQMTLNQMGFVSDLHSTETIRCVVRRFPMHIRSKWVELADKVLASNVEPNFGHLCEFVESRARIASTMYGMELANDAQATGRQKGPNQSVKQKKGVHVFSQSKQNAHNATVVCKFCSENHHLASCGKFASNSFHEKSDFVKKHKLCFNCLRYGHISFSCPKSQQCTKCKGKHHGIMHNDRIVKTENEIVKTGENAAKSDTSESDNHEVNTMKTNVSSNGDREISMRILPVVCRGNGVNIKTYCMIDCGSDVTLCSRSLLNDLNIPNEPVTYNVTSINGRSKRHERQCAFTVSSLDQNESIYLDCVKTVDKLPISINSIPHDRVINEWPHLKGVSVPRINETEVKLLIGLDCPEVFWPIEERRGKIKEPFAVKSLLGWTIVGPVNKSDRLSNSSNVYTQQCVDLSTQLEFLWKQDFQDNVSDNELHMSVEDKQALDIMESTVTMETGKYKLSLPWRDDPSKLPNNRIQAESRLQMLKRKFERQSDGKFFNTYHNTIKDYIAKGHARKLSPEETSGAPQWYLPHHAVINPNKPNKVRVVFDCAAKFGGMSLNNQLLQGPNFFNSLAGILLRFRQYPVALVSDIEAMFHQIRVLESDANFLRFLWWDDGDINREPDTFCMLVHLFGATSSPSCTAFCLRKTALDNSDSFSREAVETILKDFYVDDCLKSVSTVSDGIDLVSQLTNLLSKGGFHLTKWLSNSREVLQSIPSDERASTVSEITFDTELPIERTLGLCWNVQSDCFTFKYRDPKKPLTRRGILSMTSSLFDPLGLLAPIVLIPKLILQNVCRLKCNWDDPIPASFVKDWNNWSASLQELPNMSIPRCLASFGIRDDSPIELHVFCDASEVAYGAAVYLKVYDVNGESVCNLLYGKSRLAPLKNISVPRLELSAAVVAVQAHQFITKELDISVSQSYFWTDSMSTLRYIQNENKRFKTFVANRLAIIHEGSTVNDWRYVPSHLNPADLASRGFLLSDGSKLKYWLNGPKFLLSQKPYLELSHIPLNSGDCSDLEVKEEKGLFCTSTSDNGTDKLLHYFSSWSKLKRAVAYFERFKHYLQHKSHGTDEFKQNFISVAELKDAETSILKYAQFQEFGEEIATLSKGQGVKKSSSLRKLCPMVDNGILRVSSRLQGSYLSPEQNPIIVPSKHHVSRLIIREVHEENGHIGVNHVLSITRLRFWITRGPSNVKGVIDKCMVCRKNLKGPCEQQMSPLPPERVTPDLPPFSFVGVDFFGPIMVKVGRSTVKRYGCLFTCMVREPFIWRLPTRLILIHLFAVYCAL